MIDRDVAPFALPRAIVFDAEIMRVFDSLGLAEALAQITRPLGGSIYLGVDHRPIRTFRSPGPAHAYAWAPSNLFFQPRLEAAIRDGIARYPNVRILTGCELEEIVASPTSVAVRASGGVELEARYLLACDGASSTVRKRLGGRLDDIGFEERWLVVDVNLRGPMRWPDTHTVPPEVRDGRYSLMLCDPAQPATLIPGVGVHRRWEYMLQAGETDAAATDPARLMQRLSDWADPADIEILRSAVYRFRALVADYWRHGPVFLLGDAAHQTPPFFGQGMCHGIRDAAQLIWKLCLVLSGTVAPAVLDTYQPEREPHVRSIIAASVKAGAAVCITDPDSARARDAEFRAMEAARGTATVAMTDVVPPIRTGLIDAATGGARLPEFAVAEPGCVSRLDGLLAGHFTILSTCPVPLPPGLAQRWAALGGQAVTVPPAQDYDGRLAGWLAQVGAHSALLRPDRYVYGLAPRPLDLAPLITELLDRLGQPANPRSGESAVMATTAVRA